MTARYFEDFQVGERFTSRGLTLSEAQIIDFALSYDPQPFHMDKEAAAASPFGGLIASGFQTFALAFRLFYQENLIAACSLGSPGVERLRWHRPVRPGDTLRTEVEVKELRPSGSKPDRGYATMAYTAKNQNDEIVLSFTCTQIFKRRP